MDMTVDEMERQRVDLIDDGKVATRFIESFVDAGARHCMLGFVPIRDANETIRSTKSFGDQVLPNCAP